MHVSQCKYARELLEKANMTNANPVPTPMVSSPTLTSLIGVALEDARLYRQTVGGLQYLCLYLCCKQGKSVYASAT